MFVRYQPMLPRNARWPFSPLIFVASGTNGVLTSSPPPYCPA